MNVSPFPKWVPYKKSIKVSVATCQHFSKHLMPIWDLMNKKGWDELSLGKVEEVKKKFMENWSIERQKDFSII
jgi:hypothetical protein